MAKARDGYMVAGETHTERSDIDVLVVRTDLHGKMPWRKTYGGNTDDVPRAVIPIADGGFMNADYTFSFGMSQRDYWVFKIDDSGNIVCSRTQGRHEFEEAYSIVEVASGEFLLVGWTDSIGRWIMTVTR